MNKEQLIKRYLDKVMRNPRDYQNVSNIVLMMALYRYVKENNIDFATLAITICAKDEDRQKAFDFWGIKNEDVNVEEIKELFSDYISRIWSCYFLDKPSRIIFEEPKGIFSVNIIRGRNHLYIDAGDMSSFEKFGDDFDDVDELRRFLSWIK